MDDIDLLLDQAILLAAGRSNSVILNRLEVGDVTADASINDLLGIDQFLELVTNASSGAISVITNYLERNEVENAWIYEYTAEAHETTTQDSDALSQSETVDGERGDLQTDID